jgi:predicted small secreted protein
MNGGMTMRRPCLVPPAVLLAVTVLAACGNDDGGAQIASAAATSAAAAPAAQEGCRENLVREALANAGQAETFEYEITYLKCAEGFGWALVDPIPENFDTGTALLRVTGTEVELLDLGTSICTADHGIPADVAAQIAPPGVNPAGDCPPGPAPAPAEPGAPIQAEPDFTG